MAIQLMEPFRSMRFIILLVAAFVNTLGFVAYYSAYYHNSDASQSVVFDSMLIWTVLHYLSITTYQLILWILVLLHFLGETPNVASKLMFSFIGIVFFAVIGVKGLIVIYGRSRVSSANHYVPWTGTATTPTYVFCCLTVCLLLLLELYFGYREEGCGSLNSGHQTEADA